MREKLKSNMLDNSRVEGATGKRPTSIKPEKQDDDDEYSNGSFEKDDNDAGANGED